MARVAVNHEAWIEPRESKLHILWGHYPNIDGRLDPHVVRDIIVVGESGRITPVLLVHEKSSLRLEWGSGTPRYVLIRYIRGPFTKANQEWIYGDRCTAQLVYESRAESMLIEGYAAYASRAEPDALELLRLVPAQLQPEVRVEDGRLVVNHSAARVWCAGREETSKACQKPPALIQVKVDAENSTPCIDKTRYILTLYIARW